jgi:hypothetical protein
MENDDEITDEDLKKASDAYLTFVHRFSEYVKEMDYSLWSRAREYASDFTQIPGVKIELVDDDEDMIDDRDSEHKNGAD